MKIASDNRAEIFLSKRQDNGVAIRQGKSQVWLSRREALDVAAGLTELAGGMNDHNR